MHRSTWAWVRPTCPGTTLAPPFATASPNSTSLPSPRPTPTFPSGHNVDRVGDTCGVPDFDGGVDNSLIDLSSALADFAPPAEGLILQAAIDAALHCADRRRAHRVHAPRSLRERGIRHWTHRRRDRGRCGHDSRRPLRGQPRWKRKPPGGRLAARPHDPLPRSERSGGHPPEHRQHDPDRQPQRQRHDQHRPRGRSRAARSRRC
jgi:hypothetical protein